MCMQRSEQRVTMQKSCSRCACGQAEIEKRVIGDLSLFHEGFEGLLGSPNCFLIHVKRVEDCDKPDSKSKFHTQLREWRTWML